VAFINEHVVTAIENKHNMYRTHRKTFYIRFQEHFQDFKYGNAKFKFAQHLIDKKYSIALMKYMEILI
jgi:hypothetical protein